MTGEGEEEKLEHEEETHTKGRKGQRKGRGAFIASQRAKWGQWLHPMSSRGGGERQGRGTPFSLNPPAPGTGDAILRSSGRMVFGR